MNREQIIEAMARGLAEHSMTYAEPAYYPTTEDYEAVLQPGMRMAREEAKAALTALEATIPGLADVIAGKAVIVPVEANKGHKERRLSPLVQRHHLTPDDIYHAVMKSRPK